VKASSVQLQQNTVNVVSLKQRSYPSSHRISSHLNWTELNWTEQGLLRSGPHSVQSISSDKMRWDKWCERSVNCRIHRQHIHRYAQNTVSDGSITVKPCQSCHRQPCQQQQQLLLVVSGLSEMLQEARRLVDRPAQLGMTISTTQRVTGFWRLC